MIKLIAGPCSAESRGVTLGTAAALAELSPQFESLGFELVGLRASVWKPRTRPGNYEGPGERALEWLASSPVPAFTEVGTPAHVEAALKAGVRHFWIGARTTTNPFDVQAIADALRGTDAQVFVKNPMNPDVELWIGAVERLHACGLKDIALIHRGFSFYEKNRYRNQPKWQVPIDVMRLLPQFPMFCDPSHIGGSPEYLREISQKALDLGYDGLFVETHLTPVAALSDSRQQITPMQLLDLLRSLVIKHPAPEDAALSASGGKRRSADSYAEAQRTLEQLRTQIDELDEGLIGLLAERMKVSEAVGECKRAHNLQILQPARWEEVLRRVEARGHALGLDPDFVTDLYKLIHQASIDRQ